LGVQCTTDAGPRLSQMPFTQAIKTISRWGSGSKDLVAALEGGGNLAAANKGGR